MKKISIITGSRSEYGLLKNLIKLIEKDRTFKLQLIVTGMHLSKQHGFTYKEIISDGIKIRNKINLKIKNDSKFEISKSIGKGIDSFTKIFNFNKPDLVLLLGDRHEILPAALVALIYNIPVAHIGGGELTEGAIDDSIRHSITKLSHFHFVANNIYKKRIIQMGESPKNIFVTGGLGVDKIKNLKLLSKKELEKKIKFKIKKRNLIVTFHPVTLEKKSSKTYFRQILEALKKLKDTSIIFTMPNNDPEYSVIFKMVKKFVKENKNSVYFLNLGHLKYFSCVKYSKLVLGNSSSGILEVPNLKVPTVNIGNRQKGRIKGKSVIDCKPERTAILNAIKKAELFYSKRQTKSFKNPYGKQGATRKIYKILKNLNLKNAVQKKFFDINFK
tara:strand:+ start:12858 stop:14018 length:1161 start_codon:yes stop_codon:yes gene_type:complete